MTIQDLVLKRRYTILEDAAEAFLREGRWKSLLSEIQSCGSSGKARDALVTLLGLEAAGGTDSDLFREFSSLDSDYLTGLRAEATDHAIEVLREQIANRHTHFLDVEAMTLSPLAVVVGDIINARKNELAQLGSNPSRVDLLGTYYGYMILTQEGAVEGSRVSPISPEAVDAINRLVADLAHEISMDPAYETLGDGSVFENCTAGTAAILSENVKMSLYRSRRDRTAAARALGMTEDSRATSFLAHRLEREKSSDVKSAIIEAIGHIGMPSSVGLLGRLTGLDERGYVSVYDDDVRTVTRALGFIHSNESKRLLMTLLQEATPSYITASPSETALQAIAIESLGRLRIPELRKIVTPYLEDSTSRPLVRAIVDALLKQGKAGKGTLVQHLFKMLSVIGCDPASESQMKGLLSLPEVSGREDVHDYYASRIEKMVKDGDIVKNARRRRQYEVAVRLASQCLERPHSERLAQVL